MQGARVLRGTIETLPGVAHCQIKPYQTNLSLRGSLVQCTSGDVTALAAVISCGVPIRAYSSAQALEAVSSKSFSCTMCGKCCTMADDSEVWLNSKEVASIAAFMGSTVEHIGKAHLQPSYTVPGWFMLDSKTVEGPWPVDQQIQHQQIAHASATPAVDQQRQVCTFLDEATNACSIYPVRPLQCSTYPWWPEIMPLGNWKAEQQHVCEGIEHPDAPDLDRWNAAQQLQSATQHTLALEAAKPTGWDADTQLYRAGRARQ